MKRMIELVWGIIRKPNPALKRIKEEKPLKEGLIVFLFTCGIEIVFVLCFKATRSLILQALDAFTKVDFSSKVIYTVMSTKNVLAGFLTLVAIHVIAKSVNKKGDFKSLLTSCFFISIVSIVALPFALKSNSFGFIFTLPIAIWMLALLIMAIKTIYEITILRSISTYILAYLASATVFLAAFTGLLHWQKGYHRISPPANLQIEADSRKDINNYREFIKRHLGSAEKAIDTQERIHRRKSLGIYKSKEEE